MNINGVTLQHNKEFITVWDKCNLKIGHEDYPKTVRFFDRDLSTGHVTSFSM